ncbi:TonB-dependent receptor plug domain-containing protein [Termitidicoccus mucosus]|uniref:TonB-dependent receptor plug domain-containing protein n=1 Tax=Termitidicoccus mucosus TaxID=1184151 RepID=A0A178IMR5_9BACT|nr:hypothetical protein AW736_04410 [Opitutaceae bacterium TSB47]
MNTHTGRALPSRIPLLFRRLFYITCFLLINILLNGQQVPASAPETEEETVYLSRFTVTVDKESDGYLAKDTLAGTRIRTELKDVGSAVSVVTAKFLQDTGSNKSEDLLVYTTNTEVGGLGGNYAGAGNGPYLDTANARLAPQTNTRVRGLAAADNTRDFFITDIPWDSYNVGRIDLQRGPNSILFGLGSPAGIINASVNAASFTDSAVVEGRFGSYGSLRASADINKLLLKDELSVRASVLYDDTKYRQDPAFNRDERYYIAGRFDPKFLRFGSARTSLRVGYEHGDVKANRPRTTPPIDAITPWFNAMNKQTYDPRTVGLSDATLIAQAIANGDLGAGAAQPNIDGNPNPNYQPWLGPAGAIYENLATVFPDPRSGAWTAIIPGLALETGGLAPDGSVDGEIEGMPWTVWRGIRNFNDYAGFVGLPNNNLGVYKAVTLSDDSIFDFYDKLLEGPNKREWQKFDSVNVALAQTFFNEKLGIEAVYDYQKYEEGMANLLSTWSQALTIDVNSRLPDGTPNPNVGRPMVVGSNNSNFSRETERESWRFTAYGELDFKDFMDPSSWLTRLLGRHVFTGLYSTHKYDLSTRNWASHATDDAYGELIRVTGINTNQRQLATINYLGPSLLDASSASGARIGRLGAVQRPSSGRAAIYDSTWTATGVSPGDPWTTPTGDTSTQSENPANYAGWRTIDVGIWNADTGDIDSLYLNGSMSRDKIESTALVWQGFLLDGILVPTIGWRKDTLKSYKIEAGSADVKNPNGSINFNHPNWRLPGAPYNEETGRSTSWSVVAHTPKWIVDKMPGRTSLSLFYNRSENFQPAGSRVDIMGNGLASPNGKTKDYGFVISTLNDRLTLKVNWYETSITNATLTGLGGDYMIGAAEAWGYMFAMQARNGHGSFSTGYEAGGGLTKEEAMALQQAAVDAFLGNLAPEQFMRAWNYADQLDSWQSWIQPNAPAGMAVTGDTFAKGIEIELTAQPLKNWNITLNVSKTRAQRLNMAGSFASWIEDRWQFYQGPAGDVRLWGPWYDAGETIRGKFEREFYSNYRLYRLQEGADVPELRRWRFNIVTNYAFAGGLLKGVNVGAGYRWQDKVVTGYAVTDGDFDLSRPYYGPTEDAIDFWIGYQRKLTDKITWRIQLNIRNLFDDARLVPVTVQPDGSPGSSRIVEGMAWSVSNKLEF